MFDGLHRLFPWQFCPQLCCSAATKLRGSKRPGCPSGEFCSLSWGTSTTLEVCEIFHTLKWMCLSSLPVNRAWLGFELAISIVSLGKGRRKACKAFSDRYSDLEGLWVFLFILPRPYLDSRTCPSHSQAPAGSQCACIFLTNTPVQPGGTFLSQASNQGSVKYFVSHKSSFSVD